MLPSLGSLITCVCPCVCVFDKERWRGMQRKKRRVIRYLSSHTPPHPLPYLPEGRGVSSKPCHEFLTTPSVCSLRRCVCVHVCMRVFIACSLYRKCVGEKGKLTQNTWVLYSPLMSHKLQEYDAWCIKYWTAVAHTHVSYHKEKSWTKGEICNQYTYVHAPLQFYMY